MPGILALAGLVLTVGFLSGLYPSVILSGLEPIKALGNKVKIGGGAWVRKSLVVFQFFVSIGLLISTFVVKTQLDYMQEVNLGYQKEQVVALPYHYNMRKSIETLKQEMLRTGAAESIALASDMPIFIQAGYRIFRGGDNQNEFMITGYSVDKDLVKTIGLEILEGENFLDTDLSRTMAYDSSMEYPVILNESALQQLGWNAGEAIGRKVNFGGGMAHVKGVVKNFYFNSLHHGVGPLAIFIDPEQANVLLLRLPAGNPAVHLARLEQAGKKWLLTDLLITSLSIRNTPNCIALKSALGQCLDCSPELRFLSPAWDYSVWCLMSPYGEPVKLVFGKYLEQRNMTSSPSFPQTFSGCWD